MHRQELQAAREAYKRLTAPQHAKASHYLEQQKIEGYFENRSVPGFLGSIRLLKLDSQFGTIQLGYDPRKQQSFLFANIKTSILDTAPSRYQRELADSQMMRGLKTGTQNLAFTARRRSASSVLVFKAETQPWSLRSVNAYLRRANMEALRKTMPFADRQYEREALYEAQAQAAQLRSQSQNATRQENAAALRAQLVALNAEQESLQAVLYRKGAGERHFFRRVNLTFDLQKQQMFDHYRRQGPPGPAPGQYAAAEPPETEKPK